MMVLCTYPLATSRATDVFDTARTHHLAVVRRDDRWEMIETPTLKRTKEEIQRLTEELEQRVAGRTAQLRRSEAYLAEGERLSHTGSFAWDVTRREITFWSAEQFRIFGFEPRDHPPRVDEVNARLHPDDRSAWAALEETMVRERRGVDFDYRVLLPNGETRYVHAVPRPVVDDAGHVVEIIGSAIDVTERKRAAARLARTKRLARERALQARFAAILEERTRLSREIHDTLLQGVTGIALQLRATLPHLSAAPVPVQGSIRQIVELAEKTIRDARRAVWDMRVAAVVQHGLSRALEDEVRRVAAGLELRFAIEGRPRTLPPSVEDVIFRVAAEAVANVVRHADARTVSVTLRYERRAVHLTIEDDGRGFASDPAFRANAGRWGLLGMRERAERVDASLSIRSDRGEEGAGGTTVELLVPDVRLGSPAATLRSADEPAPMRAD
jgi:PAS domain S-box-containing protein